LPSDLSKEGPDKKRSNSPHTMQGHAALTTEPGGVRKNAPHGGQLREWSASYPGDAHIASDLVVA